MSISPFLVPGPPFHEEDPVRSRQRGPEEILAFIEEREFNDTFKGIVVYVEAVNQKKKQLKGIYIETSGRENAVITSEKGTIEPNRG